MTILPKKKQTKEKNEGEVADHSHSQLPAANENVRVARSRIGHIASGSREDRLTTHDPGGLYDNTSATHNHNKRRHRSSPHRSARKHRHDRHERERATHCSSPNTREHPRSGPVSPETSQLDLDDDMQSGYNSEDEYVPPPHPDNLEEVNLV